MESNEIAKEMKRLFGKKAKVIKVKMLYEDEAREYVMGIEEAHKKAAHSTLIFKGR